MAAVTLSMTSRASPIVPPSCRRFPTCASVNTSVAALSRVSRGDEKCLSPMLGRCSHCLSSQLLRAAGVNEDAYWESRSWRYPCPPGGDPKRDPCLALRSSDLMRHGRPGISVLPSWSGEHRPAHQVD